MVSMFTSTDLEQIQQKGMTIETVQDQLENFEKGFPFLDIQRAATVGKGIIQLDLASVDRYIMQYDKLLSDREVLKFVPASGAASRMFKALFAFMETYDGSRSAYEAFLLDQSKNSLFSFFRNLNKFAFYEELKAVVSPSMGELLLKKQYTQILRALLTDEGLDYGNLPKGLLTFHTYPQKARTAVEEHLMEGVQYGKDAADVVKLHFTVSPEHRIKFDQKIKEIVPEYESKYLVTFDISFSEQLPSTDTIAVDMNNEPFRNADNSILFRPGGHGALIHNLDQVDADIVFIKNIDNVVPDHLKGETIRYKKALAGILLTYQHRIFHYLEKLTGTYPGQYLTEVEDFMEKELCVLPPEGYTSYNWEDKLKYLIEKLDRPLRVCGMVKNEGEPGGGPYWVKNSDGSTSLQIVESAQIDKENEEQYALMQNATHFNPVDLVCATKDRNGMKYNLLKYRDPSTGFIAYKSKNGKELKAQELPGLWNGAMAYWNTIFVEVPVITFNPVKTVNDLLRPQHQGE